MFLWHGASQHHKHSVIKVQLFFFSKGFLLSLTSTPSYLFHRKINFSLNLYFPKNCMYGLNFKTLPNYSLSFSYRERSSFELNWWIWSYVFRYEIHYESVSYHETHQKSGFTHKEYGHFFINTDTVQLCNVLKHNFCFS